MRELRWGGDGIPHWRNVHEVALEAELIGGRHRENIRVNLKSILVN